jgi:hypothetical protein
MIDDDHDDDGGAISGKNDWQGKPKYSEKSCPSVVLAITDPTHDFSPSRTQVAAVEGWRLTA